MTEISPKLLLPISTQVLDEDVHYCLQKVIFDEQVDAITFDARSRKPEDANDRFSIVNSVDCYEDGLIVKPQT